MSGSVQRRVTGEALARQFWALRLELGLEVTRALSLGENDPASPPVLRRMAIELRATCPSVFARPIVHGTSASTKRGTECRSSSTL